MLLTSSATRVSAKVRWGFGLSYLAAGATSQLVAVLGLRFMTDSLGISAGIAATIFAVIRIWDGFVDPTVGYWSDRTVSPWGRRIPYLIAGSLLLPLSIAGFFGAPHLSSPVLVAGFVAIMLMLQGAGYSLIMVPTASMSVEVSDDYHQRSVIQTYRSYGGFISGVLGSSLPPFLLVAWGAGRFGYNAMGLTIAALVLALGLFSCALLRRTRATALSPTPSGNLWSQVLLAWRNKPFRIMVLVHIMFMIGVATASSSNAYFTRYVLGRSDAWLASFYIFLTLGNVLAMPIWLHVSRLWDKKNTYCMALFLYGATVLSWVFSGPSEPLWVLIVRDTAVGMAMSGVMLMAGSMLTDAVRYDYIQTGHRREGAFSGFISLIDKFSSAIGLAFMGILLAKMGYVSSHSGMTTQTHAATSAIAISFAVIPALTAFLSILLMRFYTLSEDDIRENLRVLSVD